MRDSVILYWLRICTMNTIHLLIDPPDDGSAKVDPPEKA